MKSQFFIKQKILLKKHNGIGSVQDVKRCFFWPKKQTLNEHVVILSAQNLSALVLYQPPTSYHAVPSTSVWQEMHLLIFESLTPRTPSSLHMGEYINIRWKNESKGPLLYWSNVHTDGSNTDHQLVNPILSPHARPQPQSAPNPSTPDSPTSRALLGGPCSSIQVDINPDWSTCAPDQSTKNFNTARGDMAGGGTCHGKCTSRTLPSQPTYFQK